MYIPGSCTRAFALAPAIVLATLLAATDARAAQAIQLATGELLAPRPSVARFDLVDGKGRVFTRASLRGQWSMLFFGYTHCADVCPTTLATLAAMQRRERAAGAPAPRIVFVSADAARDTPVVVGRFVARFDRGFLGVTAAHQSAIDTFARALDTAVVIHGATGNYAVDHTGAIFVVDPRGALAAVLTGPFTPAALQADFAKLVAAGP
jgi:protein SCO1/2